MGAVGAFTGAKTQRTLLNAQADVAEINARMAEAAARSARQAGQRQEQASRLQTRRVKGAQRAALAANGVDIGVGSAAESLATTDIVGEWDANTISANALRTAWGYRMEGVNFRNDANARRAGASAISPGMAGVTSLLGGAGQVAASWYRFQQAGAFGGGTDIWAPGYDDWTQARGGWTGGR